MTAEHLTAIVLLITTVAGASYTGWREVLRPAWRELRWLSHLLDMLHRTDIAALALASTATEAKLTEVAHGVATAERRLTELAGTLATWAVDDQRRSDRILTLVEQSGSHQQLLTVTLDGVDTRVERLETQHDRPHLHPPVRRTS